jgi:hypothetical protein
VSGFVYNNKYWPADGASLGYYGAGVAVSGDGRVIAVGSRRHPTVGNAGSVYVYDRDEAGVITQRGSRFYAASPVTNYEFGNACALNSDGTVLAVGEWRARRFDNLAESGCVYVYDWNGSAWVLRAGHPINPSPVFFGRFGGAVALSPDGSTLVVGAPDYSSSNGAVHVFDWSGSAWVLRGSPLAGGAASTTWFGESVALSSDGNLLAVGEPGWDMPSPVVVDLGRVRIFERNGSGWTETGLASHPSPDTGWVSTDDEFGRGVAFAGNGAVLVVGAWQRRDGGSAAPQQGRVIVFDRDGVNWNARDPMIDPGGSANDQFGADVAITENAQFLAIGAMRHIPDGTQTGALFTYDGPPLPGEPILGPITVTRLSNEYGDGPIFVRRLNAPVAGGAIKVSRNAPLLNGAWMRIARTVQAAATGAITVTRERHTAYASIRAARSAAAAGGGAIAVQRLDQTALMSQFLTWRPIVTIDGVDYTARTTGPIDIEREVNSAALAEFTLLPDPGAVNATHYLRKTVRISWVPSLNGSELYGANGVLLYTGHVERAIWDAPNRVIRVTASSQMQRQADAMTNEEIAAFAGGSWSSVVFEPSTGFQYLNERMSTQRADVYHDAMGLLRKAAWGAAATAHWPLAASDIIDGSAEYPHADVSRIINRVRMTIGYRFPRLRHREVRMRFEWPYDWCTFLQAPFQLPTKGMVESAARGTSPWVLQGSVGFYEVPPAQVFQCFFDPYVWGGGTLPGGLSYLSTGLKELCRGAFWKVARRWAQTVTEHHVLDLQATDSITAHGEYGWQEQFALESTVDGGAWASSLGYSEPPTGAKVLDGSGDRYVDGTDGQDGDAATRADLDAAQVCAQGVGDRIIAGSHRGAEVRFATPLHPSMELGDTAHITTDALEAKGQITSIRHRLSTDAEAPDCRTDVTLALSRTDAGNTATPDPLDPLPEITPPAEPPFDATIYLPWRIGGTVTAAPYSEEWTGFTTNYGYDPDNQHPFSTDPNAPQTQMYPVQLVAQAPDIAPEYTDPADEYQTATRVVAIPDDLLEITA